MKTSVALMAAALAVILLAHGARADGLRVLTSEGVSWPDAVAALQARVDSEGSTLRVHVVDEAGRTATCGEYSLALDATSTAAFEPGACEPSTSSTPLRLARRSALFAHGDFVAHPLSAGISVLQVRRSDVAGGAPDRAETQVRCSIAVRPFVRDLERGVSVELAPGRFELRALSDLVTTDTDAHGWVLRTGHSGTVTVEYEVRDIARDVVVLRERATLACGTTRLDAPPASREDAAITSQPAPCEVFVDADRSRPAAPVPNRWMLAGGAAGFVVGVALIIAAIAILEGDGAHGSNLNVAFPTFSVGLLGVAVGSGAIVVGGGATGAAHGRRPQAHLTGLAFSPTPGAPGATAGLRFSF